VEPPGVLELWRMRGLAVLGIETSISQYFRMARSALKASRQPIFAPRRIGRGS
jgi:hypothetical protein